MRITEKKTLEDWKEIIEREVDFVDIKPYSHNIISCGLKAIAEKWGQKEANKCIDEFGLDKLGWSKKKEKVK